jgi:hypothetical protein
MESTPRTTRNRIAAAAAVGLTAWAAVLWRAAPLRAPEPLQAAAAEPQARPLPTRLSETGLYVAGSTTQVDARNLPYVPQYPLWSDGATKRRFIRLPEGARIDASNPDAWQFPAGTRFWKELSFERRVETRYIERLADGNFRFATYVWRGDGADAVLAPERGVAAAAAIGSAARHDIPSRSDCGACHDGKASPILGFGALQLSGDRDPGAPHREPVPPDALDLAELSRRGLLENLPARLLERAPRIAGNATTRAALGYLFANCANCHNRVGPLATLGLDFEQSVQRPTGDAALRAGAFGTPSRFRPDGYEALRIEPGNPARSTVALRMRSRNPVAQMPPLATRLVDAAGVELIERWISEQR